MPQPEYICERACPSRPSVDFISTYRTGYAKGSAAMCMTSQTLAFYPLCGHTRVLDEQFHLCTDQLARAQPANDPSSSTSNPKQGKKHQIERGDDVCYVQSGLCEECALWEEAQYERTTGMRLPLQERFAEKSF